MSILCTPERLASTADMDLHYSKTGRIWIILTFHATNERISIPVYPMRPLLAIFQTIKPLTDATGT